MKLVSIMGSLLLLALLDGCSGAYDNTPPTIVTLTLSLGSTLVDNDPNLSMPGTLVVNTQNGDPVAGATVRLTLTYDAYQKGTHTFTDTDHNGSPDHWVINYAVATVPDGFGGCPNEDANGDGVLQPGEDLNNNGRLDPGSPPTPVATLTTDQNGTVQFNVTYPKTQAKWISATVEAEAIDAFTGSATSHFVLPERASDNAVATPPPNRVSPFGTASSCTNPA